MIGHDVMAGTTQRIAIAQLLLSFARIGSMVTFKVFKAIAEHTAPIITSKDLLPEEAPIDRTIMGIVLWHERSLT